MLEQREDRRLDVAGKIRAMAQGKIAKVMDISAGGLSLRFLDESHHSVNGEICIALLCEEKGLDTRQIPGTIVWDREVSFSSIPGMVYKQVGIRFGSLTSTQHRHLQKLFSTTP